MSRKSSRRTAGRSKRNRSQKSRSLLGRSLSGRSTYSRTLRLEPLEDRRLLAVVTVTTTDDTINFNDGLTSLREAIFAANLVSGADTINFAPSVTASGPAKILLTQGRLEITDALSINGPGPDLLAIDASGNDPTPTINDGLGSQVFNVDDGSAAEINVAIAGLTITGGDKNLSGGGIASSEALTLSHVVVTDNAIDGNTDGAGIYSTGPLQLIDSIVENNDATGANSNVGDGGGIYSHGELTITGGRISNNRGRNGGAIFSTYANVTLDNVTISGNFAERSGGGVAAFFGDLSVTGSTISNNVSQSGTGGGAVSGPGKLTLTNSIVSGNSTSNAGGGIYGSRVTVDHSIISNNHVTDGRGGGIWAGRVTITDSVVSGNSAEGTTTQFSGNGGGVYCIGTVTVSGSTISGNSAAGNGGGIVGTYFYSLNISSSTISNNTAALKGGGIYSQGTKLAVFNSTISGNHASSGGGAYVARSAGQLGHVIVAMNSADSGPDLFGLDGNAVGVSFSLIGDSAGTSLTETPVGLPDENGNLVGGPVHGMIDPKLGPLADNGGFALPDGSHVLTQALLAGSPAINAGDLSAVAGQGGVPAFDERGTPFGRVFGGRIDIGAFEYQAASDLNLLVDMPVDESDGNYERGDLSLREAIELANLYPGADIIHFDPMLTADGQAKILLTGGELAISDALAIDGPGADLLTIDAQQQSRIFDITATTGDCTIDGLTLTGGKVIGFVDGLATYNGGAIRSVTTGLLTLDKLIVTANSTANSGLTGGGVFAKGDLVLNQCTVSGNTSMGNGGGVFLGGDLTAVGSTVSNNSSIRYGGGGIYAKGDATLTDSVVTGNHATDFASRRYAGGGIRAMGKVAIVGSSVTNNSAGSGGGIYGYIVTLDHSTVSGNIATQGSGGGIYAGEVTLDHSILSGNSAPRGNGGGMSVKSSNLSANPNLGDGQVSVADSSITNNTARRLGGGIFSGNSVGDTQDPFYLAGSVSIERSTVSENVAGQSGAGVFSSGTADVLSSTVAGNHISGNVSAMFGNGGAGIFAVSDVYVSQSEISANTVVTTSPGSGAGAGIRSHGSVTIDQSTITANDAGHGGAGGVIAVNAITVTKSTISGNSGYNGGGLLADSITLTDTVVSGNMTTGGYFGFGGGIVAYLTATITRSEVIGNSASGSRGGGIIGGNIVLRDSLVSDNSAAGSNSGGGGIATFGPVTLYNSTVANNRASGNGGGIAAGSVHAVNSTISGNSAGLSGGGIWVNGSTSTIDGSTIYNNRANAVGGGLFINSGMLTVIHSIVAGNFFSAAPDVAGLLGAVVDASFSLIGSSAGSGLAPAPFGLPDANGNLVGGAKFDLRIDPKLGPLVYNGGPEFLDGSRLLTHALLPGSPAINAGDPAAVAGVNGVPVNDERGVPFARVFGGRIDMGAVEYQPNPLPGDFNFDGVVDTADYTVWADTGGSRIDLRADGNGDGVVNQLDFEFWKAHFGQVLVGKGAASGGAALRADVVPQGVAESGTAEQASSGTGDTVVDAGSDTRAASLEVALSAVVPGPRVTGRSAGREAFRTSLRGDLLFAPPLAVSAAPPRSSAVTVARRVSQEGESNDSPSDLNAAIDRVFALLGSVI
jgi:predicted outer membrane repeat protein